MAILSELEPKAVFEFFEQLCAIPHGSGDTGAVSAWLADFAERRGLDYSRDAHDNIIIRKPGALGGEHSEPVILQGHMDMVCEKERDCAFDFKTMGLRLRLDGKTVSAEGTTLGGDDGFAVACCLALLDAGDLPHPPLEVVLTSDEEIGMLGAAALDMSQLRGRRMLNLDSEDEGILLSGCAGGALAVCTLPIRREAVSGGQWRTLTVDGLLGGHSGTEIDKGRANAATVLGRVLYTLAQRCPIRLAAVSGGGKDNAIPRAAEATLWTDSEAAAETLASLVRQAGAALAAEYRTADSGLRLRFAPCGAPAEAPMDAGATDRVIAALLTLPNGIQRMSVDMPGLPETSLNLGILSTGAGDVTLSYCVRSSVESAKAALLDRMACQMKLLGGTMSVSGNYPGWQYRPDSPLRDTCVAVFRRCYGRDPEVAAIHAGVECGLFAGALPGLDAVSMGPDMRDIHTPQETMDADSVRRTWEYLLAILRELTLA